MAKLAETQLRGAHQAELERLRTVATPLLGRLHGRGLVVDPHGWVAAVSGLAPVNLVRVPDRIDQDRAWLPALGSCLIEPLPGGWLVPSPRTTSGATPSQPPASCSTCAVRPTSC